MDFERKIDLIKLRPSEEILTEEELHNLIKTKDEPVAYDGFEASGIPGIHTILLKSLKVKDFTDAGITFKIFLADWHSILNRKLKGNREMIRIVYLMFIEAWRSLFEAYNIPSNKVEFVFGTEIYDQDYWFSVVNISQNMTLQRAIRGLTIAGRKEADVKDLGTFFYVPMQVADIFRLKADICQLGMDQRKANILAREVAPSLGLQKPVCVHHHLLMGLEGPKRMGFEEDEAIDVEISSKMSKSDPGNSILVTDEPEAVVSKIKRAYCPVKVVEGNPIIDICRNIILRTEKDSLTIERPQSYGGTSTFWGINELEEAYSSGKLHPLDLKQAVGIRLGAMLEPCRTHFKTNQRARELLRRFNEFTGNKHPATI